MRNQNNKPDIGNLSRPYTLAKSLGKGQSSIFDINAKGISAPSFSMPGSDWPVASAGDKMADILLKIHRDIKGVGGDIKTIEARLDRVETRLDTGLSSLSDEAKETNKRIDDAAKKMARFQSWVEGVDKTLSTKIDGVEKLLNAKISTTNKIAVGILIAVIAGLIIMLYKL